MKKKIGDNAKLENNEIISAISVNGGGVSGDNGGGRRNVFTRVWHGEQRREIRVSESLEGSCKDCKHRSLP